MENVEVTMEEVNELQKKHQERMDKLMEDAKILTNRSDDMENAKTTTKEATTMESENKNENENKTKETNWADAIGVGLIMVGVIGFTAICAIADANEKKATRALYEKAIDADLEARKYEADKKCEAETKTTSDIKDIVHDITTIKN
jgi:TolA-binding protein